MQVIEGIIQCGKNIKTFRLVVCLIPISIGLFFILTRLQKGTLDLSQIESSSESHIDFLWKATVGRMLQEPLWQARDAYDAGHFLMIPLYGAFHLKDSAKINDFHRFFVNFVENYKKDNFNSLDILTRLHFLYLASEYLVLTKSYNQPINLDLTMLLTDTLKAIWHQPAWQWKQCHSPVFRNMSERIQWKLENKTNPYSYCRAIIDEELFVFAIAADLKTILVDKSPQFIDEILMIAYRVFNQEIVFLDTTTHRWLFQPGVWADHPDYAYTGWSKIEPLLDKNPIPEIAWDTSHFHRFPLWLISLKRGFAAKGDFDKVGYFEKLRYGLTKQFQEKVLIPPSEKFPNYRTTNFMDGSNGVYRYNYSTVGAGRGYGPYELSGTILLGWWAFLPDKSIKQMYRYIASRYPFSEIEIRTYLGPDTLRDRHPFIKGKAQFESGLLKLIEGVQEFPGDSLPHSGQFRPRTDSHPSDTHFEHGSFDISIYSAKS